MHKPWAMWVGIRNSAELTLHSPCNVAYIVPDSQQYPCKTSFLILYGCKLDDCRSSKFGLACAHKHVRCMRNLISECTWYLLLKVEKGGYFLFLFPLNQNRYFSSVDS